MKSKTIKLFLFTFLMCLSSLGMWANYTEVWSQKFETADFSTGWATVNDGQYGRITFTQKERIDISGHYLHMSVSGNGADDAYYNFKDEHFSTLDDYQFEMDFALGTATERQTSIWITDTDGNVLFRFKADANNSKTGNLIYGETIVAGVLTLDISKFNNIKIRSNSNGTTLYYTPNGGVTQNYLLSDGIVKLKALHYYSGKYYPTVAFDNFILYQYAEGYVATPVAEMTKVNGTKRNIGITCPTVGSVIYYSMDDGNSWTKYTSEFEISENTTIKAKATVKNDDFSNLLDSDFSEVASFDVEAGTEITLATPQIELSSYNITDEGALNAVKFAINVPDNSGVLLSPNTDKLEYSFTPDGGVESERFEIEDGFVYEPTVFGVLKIYANTVGYDGSFLEIPVSNYYINNYTYNYDGITAELFEGKANWKTVESGWWEGAEVYRCTDDRSYTLGRFRFGNNTVTDVVLGWGIGRSDKICEFQLRNRKSGEINVLDIHTNTDGTDKSPFTQMTFLATSGDGKETDLYPKSYLGKLNTAKRLNVYTPSGKYEIKDVFIGSLTSEGNDVIAEDFESMESLSSSWEVNEVNSIGFSTVENVESPEVGSAPTGIPTYVSGKTFRGYIRQGSDAGERFSSFNFGAPLDKGKIMFSADFFSSGNVNTPIKLRFTDKNGNSLFSIGYKNGSSYQYLRYTIDGSAVETSARSDYRNYAGFGIKDMVIDIETGDVSFTFDCINRYGVREHVPIKFNIGTGKNIAKMQIGKAAISSTDLYYHLDNVKLYTVGLITGELNYTVAAKYGDEVVKTIKTGTSHGGKVVPVTGLPLVVENNGNFYTLDDAQVEKFSSAFQMNYADYEHTYNYVASPEIVYFNDGEKSNWGYENSSASGGYVGCWGNKTDICSTTLDAGLYDVIINVWSKSGSGSNYRRSAVEVNGYVEAMVDDNNNGEHVLSVLVPNNGASFKIYGRGSNKATDNIDYVLVRKTGDLSSVYTTTLTSAGIGTLCSPYNLDFSGAVNVAAYKAQTVDGRIKLTKVNTVAAREGVLIRSLNGGAVTEEIPVAATAYEPNEGNEFIGTLVDIESQPSEDAEYKYYILSSKTVNDAKVYGFYLANDKKIGAGKAYLRVPLAAAAKYSFFSFDDETTGVEDIELGITETDSPVYDLSGRKVVNPATGLYIKNGKKFIVK